MNLEDIILASLRIVLLEGSPSPQAISQFVCRRFKNTEKMDLCLETHCAGSGVKFIGWLVGWVGG